MSELHVLYAFFGVAALGLALGSRKVRDAPFSEPLVALALGVLIGPRVLGLLVMDQHLRDLVLLEGSRLLLAGSVMAAALRFPLDHLRRLVGPVTLLLVVVMPASALVTGALALGVGLPLTLAAVLGACLCPTDPVLAASVVTGEPAERDVPGRLRRMLTAESGANDGLALPLVGLTVAAAVSAGSGSSTPARIAWEVVGGGLVGLVLGGLAGRGLRLARERHDPEPGPELVFTLLLAVATLGVARTAGTGGVLAVFVAGLAYNRLMGEGERGAQDSVDEAVNRYAVLPLFVVLGAVLPWTEWAALGPLPVVMAVGVLVLRRLPWVLLLARPLGLRRRDAVFTGWFGPIGVSAVFYLALSGHEGVTDPRLFAVGMLVVVASVLVFGLTSAPGRRAYAHAPSPVGGR